MSIIGNLPITEADATAVGALTPTLGTYTSLGGDGIVLTGRLYQPTGGFQKTGGLLTPSTAATDYIATVTTAHYGTGGTRVVVLPVRYVDASNFYYGYAQIADGSATAVIALGRVVGGGDIPVGSAYTAFVPANSVDFVFAVSIVGTTLTALVNGSTVASATVTDFSAQGKGGFYLTQGVSNNEGFRVDTLTLDSFGGGGAAFGGRVNASSLASLTRSRLIY